MEGSILSMLVRRPSEVMRRSLFVLSISVVAVLAFGEARATMIPGSKRPRNDCLIEAEVADAIAEGSTRVRCTDGDTCDHDTSCADRSCRFRLRVCVNQSNVPGCVGGDIVKARAVVKLRGKKKMRLPLPADMTTTACGPFVDVDVPSDVGSVKKHRKKRKALLALRATAHGVDRDRIVLSCLPRPGACAAGTSQTPQDPITPDHPLWIAMKGEAVVDGVLDDPDWARAVPIVRTQAWRDDGPITIRIMYSKAGLYVSAEVADRNLWADGTGAGRGSRWGIQNDDSFTFYVDPDESRDEFLQPGDRAFGVNLGNPRDPIHGPGRVRRCRYIQGDGTLFAGDLVACDHPRGFLEATGIRWATTIDGTVNDASDSDRGWITEMFLPWAALNMAAPRHGQTMGGNFDVVFDNDGGERNFTNNLFGPDRFTLPTFVDDHVQGAYSSFHDSLSGLRGPIDYATVMFVDPAAPERPAAITDATVTGPSAYGARVQFTAPAGTTGGAGDVAGYEVRLAHSPIADEATWNAATPFPQGHRPRLAGLPEVLRIAGLTPSTSYWVAVRARDAAGHLGDLSNQASTTTMAPKRAGDHGRVIPAPNGTGLAFEDGTPFVPIGEHLAMGWAWYRNLFPGDVWDARNQRFWNYSRTPGTEGPVGPHLDLLAARGVNTLRIFLEGLEIDQTGNPEQPPRGRYWIEYPAGAFNPDMRGFVLRTLEEAGRRGIYLILSPFDTFFWKTQFAATPWFVGNGGPLVTLDDFFQVPATLDMARRRLRQVMDWVAESPWADHVLGWEPLNEWDSSWTLNAEGDAEPGRVGELRRRAVFVHALAQSVHERDPGALVFNSMIRLDPRGPLARVAFYDSSVDVMAPHFYSPWVEEPVNAPVADVTARAASANVVRTAYWTTNRIDLRPLLNAEWGLNGAKWPGGHAFHGTPFTWEDDEALFRAMTWSGLAGGQAGQGLRLAGEEMQPTLNALTPAMGEVQAALRAVATGSILAPSLVDFAPETLMGRIAASSDTGAALLAWGVHDGARGIAYVLQDRNSSSGTVSDGRLVVRGLDPDVALRVEFWATAGASATPIGAVSTATPGGVLSVALPPFTQDVLVVFAP